MREQKQIRRGELVQLVLFFQGSRLHRLLIQKVERLQKLLDPKAPLHQQCDLNALKTYVQEAEGLVRGSPRAAAVQEDLHLGVKGIVTEASQKKK